MALTPNKYLQTDSKILLRDSQTASRLFVDDGFRLAPKQKFLFHVAINVNPAALKDKEISQRHKNEIGMLVKSADLPTFEIQSETLNQYNRQKAVQYRHKFNSLNITFHDDNMGLINKLWQNYYNYYYGDYAAAKDKANYTRNATKGYSSIRSAYGLDNKSTFPFFNYITIYQMARHEYVAYKLVNPIITKWSHNKVDYSIGNQTHDNTMTLAFEAVAYSNGSVSRGDPEGFSLEHYDTTPSPLSSRGDLTSSSPSFSKGSTLDSLKIIKNVANTLSSYQGKEANPAGSTNNNQGSLTITAGGNQDIIFPRTTNSSNTTTVANQVNLG